MNAAIVLSIPLLTKLLEYAREETVGDVEVHAISEAIVRAAELAGSQPLNTSNWEEIRSYAKSIGGSVPIVKSESANLDPAKNEIIEMLRGTTVPHRTEGKGELVPGTEVKIDDPRTRLILFPRGGRQNPDGYSQTQAREILKKLAHATEINWTRAKRLETKGTHWVYQLHPKSHFRKGAPRFGYIKCSGGLMLMVGDVSDKRNTMPSVNSIPGYTEKRKVG